VTTIGVVIPVGPEEHHKTWLDECLESVQQQTHKAHRIVVVDDMAALDTAILNQYRVTHWKAPWRLGVAGAFNVGVAVAHQNGCDLALMLGADDRIEPECLAALARTYEHEGGRDGYYWLNLAYSDGREQALPCNAAAVTPGLWRRTGGFPPQAGVGAPDAILINLMLQKFPKMLIGVGGGVYYWHRVHDKQETLVEIPRGWPYGVVRTIHALHFKEPTWGRYE